jgi:hypothetical protein
MIRNHPTSEKLDLMDTRNVRRGHEFTHKYTQTQV